MRHRAFAFVALATLGVGLRLLLALNPPRSVSHSVDLDSYSIVVDVLRSGKALYESGRYHYPPLWAGALEIFETISRTSKIAFPTVVRTVLTGIDLFSAILLWSIARRIGVSSRRSVALFLFNPVSAWVTGVQGQFDNVSVFFLLAAILVSIRASGRPPAAPTVALLSLSVATKQVTALNPILWSSRVRPPAALVVPYAVTAVLFLPFVRQWRAIRDHVLLYRAVPRSYGFSELVLFDERFAPIVGLVALAAGILAAWLLRDEKDLVRASLILFLVLLFFAPGLGAQYLVWPLTLGALRNGSGYLLCTASSILWILGSHYGLAGSGRWMGHLVWLSVAFWLARELAELRRGELSERKVPA